MGSHSLTCDYLGRKFAIITTTAMIEIGGILATGGLLKYRIWGLSLRTDEVCRNSFEWAYDQWHVLDDDCMYLLPKVPAAELY